MVKYRITQALTLFYMDSVSNGKPRFSPYCLGENNILFELTYVQIAAFYRITQSRLIDELCRWIIREKRIKFLTKYR